MQSTKINFEEMFKTAKLDDQKYTKEETRSYICRYIDALQHVSLTDILHPELVSAIEKHLKGNMATHLPYIMMGEIVNVNILNTKRKKRNEHKAEKINYSQAIYTLLSRVNTDNEFTRSNVNEILNTEGMRITTGQWQVLRKLFPVKVDGVIFDIEKHGNKSTAKWVFKRL